MYRTMLAAIAFGCGLLIAADAKLLKDAEARLAAGKHEEAIALLQPAYEKAPKDAALGKALAGALLKYGDFFMFNEQLPPFRKYPGALKQYRAVLAIDKTNTDARQKIATIETIYKQMGRPIPK